MSKVILVPKNYAHSGGNPKFMDKKTWDKPENKKAWGRKFREATPDEAKEIIGSYKGLTLEAEKGAESAIDKINKTK